MNNISTKNLLLPIDPQVKARTLAAVYREILSWPDPREQKTEPAADDLSRKAEAGSADETPNLMGDCMESTREVNCHAT